MLEEIKLYYDYKSPFTYLALAPALELENTHHVRLRFIPHELDIRVAYGGDLEQRPERDWFKVRAEPLGCTLAALGKDRVTFAADYPFEQAAEAGEFLDETPLAVPVRDEDDVAIVKPPRDEVGKLIDALHAIFEQDRTISSQGSNQRCGICFLHYPAGELEYRQSEGYYVCPASTRRLCNAQLVMVRRQQR